MDNKSTPQEVVDQYQKNSKAAADILSSIIKGSHSSDSEEGAVQFHSRPPNQTKDVFVGGNDSS